jgi:hypothetical protein
MDNPMVIVIDLLQVILRAVFLVQGNGHGHGPVQMLQLMAELFLHALVIEYGGKNERNHHGNDAHQ